MRHRLFYAGILLVSASLAACGTTSAQKSATTETTTTAQKPSKPKPKPPPQLLSLRELVAKVRSGVIRVNVDPVTPSTRERAFSSVPALSPPSSTSSMGL